MLGRLTQNKLTDGEKGLYIKSFYPAKARVMKNLIEIINYNAYLTSIFQQKTKQTKIILGNVDLWTV